MMHRRAFLQSSLAAGALAACAGATGARSPAPRAKLKLLILGGTGYLGPAVVDAARSRGHVVTLFNRGQTNPGLFSDLEQLHGDRDGKLDALRGRSWDAVIDDAGFVPRIVRQSVALLEPQVRRYLFVSTISVYKDDKTLDQDETAPRATLPPEAKDSEEVRKYYSPLKTACEDVVTGAYGARATVVRPGYIVGPHDPYDRLTYWVWRCARGGDVVAPGDGTDPTQFIDVRDLGRFIVALVDGDVAGAFNATGPAKAMTMKGLLEACREGAGAASRLVWVPLATLRKHGIDPDSEAREDLPLWTPGSALGQVSIARGLAAGMTFRPAAETARDTLAWWKTIPAARAQKPMRAGLTDEVERAILAEVKS